MSAAATTTATRHTVVVRLHDRPGALYRAIGLIRRRGYNVASLVVGASERPGTSRMVLVVEACDVRQVIAQLRRLIDVLSVQEIDAQPAHVDAFVEAMLHFDSAPRESTTAQPQPTLQETAR
jgi:acetolactate synthase small subunit